MVAERERVGHRAERHRALLQARHRQVPRRGARGHHQHVVRQLAHPAVGQRDHRAPLRVVDRRHRAGDDVAASQRPAQRDREVAGLDGAGGRLGQERLVGHVRLGVDDGDPCDPAGPGRAEVAAATGATRQPGLQRTRRDESRVSAADHEDPGSFGVARRSPDHPRPQQDDDGEHRHDRAERGRAPRRERPEPPEHRDHDRAGDQERRAPQVERGRLRTGVVGRVGIGRLGVLGHRRLLGGDGHETVTLRRATP